VTISQGYFQTDTSKLHWCPPFRTLQTSGTYLLWQRSWVWNRSQRRAPREGEVAAVVPAGVGLTKGGRKGGEAQRLGEVVGQNRTVGVASAAQVRSADGYKRIFQVCGLCDDSGVAIRGRSKIENETDVQS
jgi:hypothetical protein